MKNIIPYFLTNAIVVASFLASYGSRPLPYGGINITEPKEQLSQVQQENNPEYPAFKKDAELKIADNDKRIADLRAKLAKPGVSPMDDLRRKKIDDLQKRNADMRSRLYGYEKERSDWQAFKTGFNKDADNLRKAFIDFGNDLKKKN